jgi:hypothetical protein
MRSKRAQARSKHSTDARLTVSAFLPAQVAQSAWPADHPSRWPGRHSAEAIHQHPAPHRSAQAKADFHMTAGATIGDETDDISASGTRLTRSFDHAIAVNYPCSDQLEPSAAIRGAILMDKAVLSHTFLAGMPDMGNPRLCKRRQAPQLSAANGA